MTTITPKNFEQLLSIVITACLERGKIDESALKKGKDLLCKFPLETPTFEFYSCIEAEVYIQNHEPENALQSIINSVKVKKILSRQEYANLYFSLAVRIGNQLEINLVSDDFVSENSFVKIRNREQWYFVGQEGELDAIQINNKNEKYPLLLDKKKGEIVHFSTKYHSEIIDEEIELIFPIEKYVFCKIRVKSHSNSGANRTVIPG